MMINDVETTEIEVMLSFEELEDRVNLILKKTMSKGLTDLQLYVLKGIYEKKTYAKIGNNNGYEEQTIKNAAYDLFKLLNDSGELTEKVNRSNLISVLKRYKKGLENDNNHHPTSIVKNPDKLLELEIEGLSLHDLTEENAEKIHLFVKKMEEERNVKLRLKLNGSIRLIFEGSEEDLQALRDSEELQTLLNELKSEDNHDIRLKKAEFTEDPEVIKNVELIKAIQTGTVDKNTLKGVDLSGANLREVNLRGANLSRANLSNAYLSNANLRRANLRWANLSEANLSNANLRRADLIGAYLSNANLSGADLIGAYLRWAYLSGAYLIGAYLIGADLSWAYLSKADLSKANLSRADLSRANLWMANLSEAILSKANLSEVFLWRANLREANLSGANLSGANLSGANLSGTNLSNANLIGANVENARFTNAMGITFEQKQNLINRGAIFDDPHSRDRASVLIPR